MSDAQGPKNDGDTGEEQSGATAPVSDDAPAAEQAREGDGSADGAFDAADESGSAGAGDLSAGGSDARAFSADVSEPGDDATTAGDAPEGDATPVDGVSGAHTTRDDTGSTGDVTRDDAASEPGATPVGDARPESAPSGDATRDDAEPTGGSEPASDDAAEEPDYEALAAELDRLESETASAAPVAPGAREPEESGRKPGDPWFEPASDDTFTATEPQPGATTPIDESEPASVTSSEPAPHGAPAPGPIFVQAPEPPRKRGNRGASGLIGLLAAVVFAVLYAAGTYGWQVFVALAEGGGAVDPAAFATDVLLQPPFWFTVVAFWLAFWLLGVFVNRARWWSWVVLGLFVALLTYAGYIGGAFLAAPFWNLTSAEGIELLTNSLFVAPALVAFIVAREVTIWFGGWVSRRGARVTKQNAAEREEYDRLMAEGPQAPEND